MLIMKRVLLSIVIAVFTVGGLCAQENSAEGLRWSDVTGNNFWSNWEINVGGGVNATAWHGIGNKQKSTGDVGWQVEGSLTKWFNPLEQLDYPTRRCGAQPIELDWRLSRG